MTKQEEAKLTTAEKNKAIAKMMGEEESCYLCNGTGEITGGICPYSALIIQTKATNKKGDVYVF